MLKRLLFAAAIVISTSGICQYSGNALDFDGANDLVVVNSVPSVFSAPVSSDFTIEVWVNPRGSAFQRIFFSQPSTTNFVSLGTSTGNVIYFYVIVNGTTYSVATTTSITQNTWTHLAARWTASTLTPQVFFNGVLQPTTAGGSSSTGTSGITVIGSRPGGAQYFNGLLDEIRVWSEARTQCEISNNYMHGVTGIQLNLVMNYDFNQGVPAGNNTGVITLPDNSGNSYSGTLTNFALTGTTSNWVASAATLTSQGNPLVGITSSQTASVCSGGSFTFPDGSTQTNITSTATHVSTLTAQNGCDSIINTTVNVLQPSSFAETNAVCSGNSYTFPDGSTTTNITAQVVHTSTLINVAGCDSVVTTTVNVNAVYAYDDTVWICNGMDFTFPDGTSFVAVTSPMSHVSTLSTVNSCDSVITTYLDLYPVYAANDTAWICYGGNFTFPDGTTFTGITSPASHSSLLSTINSCDSVIVTYVDFIQVDTGVAMMNETLTASASGASYQWLDCGNGMAPIAGDTSQSFTATVNGSYALAITQNGCTDTSGCFVILSTGMQSAFAASVTIYPNPAGDFVNVLTGAASGTIMLTDISGKIIRMISFTDGNSQLDLRDVSAGIYFLQVESSEGKAVRKIQKN